MHMAFCLQKHTITQRERERESYAILARAFAQQYPLNHNRI